MPMTAANKPAAIIVRFFMSSATVAGVRRNVLLGGYSRIRVGNIKLNVATLGASQGNELLFQTKG
jgi:hypothetical protein